MSYKISVEQWGYACRTDQEAVALVWPVRFKPAVTVILVIIGFVAKIPWLLIVVGGLGVLGTLFQSFSWIDLFYNQVITKITKTKPLGYDPSVRRWLCGLADVFILLSGFALSQGNILLAYILGGIVIGLAGSVVLTGICLPAYLFYKFKNRSFNNQP